MNDAARKDDLYLLALRAVFWVLAVGIVVFAMRQVWPLVTRLLGVLAPFLFGLTVAYVFHPIVQWVQDRLRLGRIGGILVVFFLVLGLFVVFFAILVPVLYGQAASVIDAVAKYLASDRVDTLLLHILPEDQGLEELKAQLTERISEVRENWGAYLASGLGMLMPVASGSAEAARGAVGAVFGFFASIVGLAVIVLLGLVVAFYVLADMAKVPGILRRMLPEPGRERLWTVMVRSDEAVGGFLRGQLVACTGVGLLASGLLFVLGLKQYAILIGFTAGAVNFIPYLGPTMGAVPAILWAFFTDDLSGMEERAIRVALIVAAFGLIQVIDGLVFQPIIVGRGATLHPLAVMLALVVGAQFGVSGMILAVPVACVVKVLFNEYYWKDRTDFVESPAARPPSDPPPSTQSPESP